MSFVHGPTAPKGQSQIQMGCCLGSSLPGAASQTPSDHEFRITDHTGHLKDSWSVFLALQPSKLGSREIK